MGRQVLPQARPGNSTPAMRTLLVSSAFSMFMLTFNHSAKADFAEVRVNGAGDVLLGVSPG